MVSVTQFHGGEAWNIIPEEVVLRGTIRSFKPEVQEAVERAVERLCSGVAAANGAQIGVHFDHRYPPTVNSVAEAEFCRSVAVEVLGSERVLTDVLPSMGAEDFAYMLREKPGCYVWLGNGPGTGGCTLHNPHYDFNDEISGLASPTGQGWSSARCLRANPATSNPSSRRRALTSSSSRSMRAGKLVFRQVQDSGR